MNNQLTNKDYAMYLGSKVLYSNESVLTIDAVCREEYNPLPLVLDGEPFENDEFVQLILRPLSDMSRGEFRIIFNKPDASDDLADRAIKELGFAQYRKFQTLSGFDPGDAVLDFLEHHFDMFGWIDAGLAVDATTLAQNPYEEELEI